MGLSSVNVFFQVIWVYSYLVLGMLLGIALAPSLVLVWWVASWDVVAGVALTGAAAGVGGLWLRAVLVGTSLGVGFFLFGLAFGLVIFLVKTLLRLGSEEGELPIPSWKMWRWFNYDGLLLIYSLIFMPFLRNHAIYPVFLRLMGAKVGKNVIVNTNQIYDLDLLEIGDNTIIGGNVVVIAHVAEGRTLIRRRVKIGRNVTIGQFSSIFPGAVIGDNVVVGAHTLVRKNAVLPPNTVWGGVPARMLRGPKPTRRPFRAR